MSDSAVIHDPACGCQCHDKTSQGVLATPGAVSYFARVRDNRHVERTEINLRKAESAAKDFKLKYERLRSVTQAWKTEMEARWELAAFTREQEKQDAIQQAVQQKVQQATQQAVQHAIQQAVQQAVQQALEHAKKEEALAVQKVREALTNDLANMIRSLEQKDKNLATAYDQIAALKDEVKKMKRNPQPYVPQMTRSQRPAEIPDMSKPQPQEGSPIKKRKLDATAPAVVVMTMAPPATIPSLPPHAATLHPHQLPAAIPSPAPQIQQNNNQAATQQIPGRIIPCTHCHRNWWPCDGAQFCGYCRAMGFSQCLRGKCFYFDEEGKCKKSRGCMGVHKNESHLYPNAIDANLVTRRIAQSKAPKPPVLGSSEEEI